MDFSIFSKAHPRGRERFPNDLLMVSGAGDLCLILFICTLGNIVNFKLIAKFRLRDNLCVTANTKIFYSLLFSAISMVENLA
jgi:hypothetical protein